MDRASIAARNEIIIRDYMAGERQSVLAERFGLRDASIAKIISKAGVHRVPNAHKQAKLIRNQRIAKAYRDGATQSQIAAQFGLSPSRISYIIKRQGAQLTLDERRARCSAHSSRIAHDPKVRAKIAEAMRQRWASGLPMGRKAILADDPERREEYLVLRDAFGAAYAREQMGLAA